MQFVSEPPDGAVLECSLSARHKMVLFLKGGPYVFFLPPYALLKRRENYPTAIRAADTVRAARAFLKQPRNTHVCG